jgi:hypothetical protein
MCVCIWQLGLVRGLQIHLPKHGIVGLVRITRDSWYLLEGMIATNKVGFGSREVSPGKVTVLRLLHDGPVFRRFGPRGWRILKTNPKAPRRSARDSTFASRTLPWWKLRPQGSRGGVETSKQHVAVRLWRPRLRVPLRELADPKAAAGPPAGPKRPRDGSAKRRRDVAGLGRPACKEGRQSQNSKGRILEVFIDR